MNEPLSMKQIEQSLYALKDAKLLNDRHQAALDAVCHIIPKLRIHLGYDAKNISIFQLINLIEKIGE